MPTAIAISVALAEWTLAVGATRLTLITLWGVGALERGKP